ncbi:hypothetical protein U1Q18_022536 [Sarracenia purpurea var. burkii]
MFEKLALDALDKDEQGRSPLNNEDLEAVVEWLAWYRGSPVTSPKEGFSSILEPINPLINEGSPDVREVVDGSPIELAKICPSSGYNELLGPNRKGDSNEVEETGEGGEMFPESVRVKESKVKTLDSSLILNQNCSVVVDFERVSDSGHKENQFEVMSKGLNSAFHVFDQMSKPIYHVIEIMESAEGVANAIPPNPKVYDGASLIIFDHRIKSVDKNSLNNSEAIHAHHVIDDTFHPGFAEGIGVVISSTKDGSRGHIDKVKVRGKMVVNSEEKKDGTNHAEAAACLPKPAASLPRSWAHVAASNGNLGPFTGEAKRNSDSRVVVGKNHSDKSSFQGPREPQPKVHGPRQEPKLWVPSNAHSVSVFYRKGRVIISREDDHPTALSARAPGQLHSIAFVKASARPPASPGA